MKDSTKAAINIAIYMVAIYLLMSAIYIFCHIDFGNPPDVVGPGFSEAENALRMIMGLPKTYCSYSGVPPTYLISFGIRLVLGTVILGGNLRLQAHWKLESMRMQKQTSKS